MTMQLPVREGEQEVFRDLYDAFAVGEQLFSMPVSGLISFVEVYEALEAITVRMARRDGSRMIPPEGGTVTLTEQQAELLETAVRRGVTERRPFNARRSIAVLYLIQRLQEAPKAATDLDDRPAEALTLPS